MYETQRNWKDGLCCALTARSPRASFLAPLTSVFSSQILKSDFTVLLTSEVKKKGIVERGSGGRGYIYIQLITSFAAETNTAL